MRVAILDDYLNIARGLADWSPVADLAELVTIDRPLRDEDDAATTLAGFDVLITLRERTPFPGSLLRRLPDLRYLVMTGQRYDTVDVATAAELGIAVSNTGYRPRRKPGAPAGPRPEARPGVSPVTELVVGLILTLARNLSYEDRLMRQGGWQHGPGMSLRGKTLGILGLGNLGAEVARAGSFFGMKVLGWSQNLTDERAAEVGATRVTKEELFAQSDFITVQLAWSDRTTGIVAAADFARMKRSAYFINTARGPIVNQPDLLAVLQTRQIAGAALDVFDVEPLPTDHPLRALDNVVLTPHLGFFVQESLANFYESAIELVVAWAGGTPQNLVNTPVARG